MLMEKVRSVTKYFMWFAALAFVLSMGIGFGANIFTKGSQQEENAVAKVNGKSIMIREYSDALRGGLQSISGALGADPIKERQMSESVINQLITDKIIEDLLGWRKIAVSEDQLIDIIRENPPPEITQNPDFWMGGQFDYDRYYQILKDPRASQFIRTYAYQIMENLPMSILRGEISSVYRVTSGEAIEKLLEDSVKTRIEYIKLSLEEWKSGKTSMSEEEFYSEHKEMFRRDYLVKLGYVSFPVQLDEETIQLTEELANAVMERAKTDSFDLLVRQYSYLPDDRALLNGWVKVKNLRKDFASTLAGLHEGKVSKPVKSNEGFHILKLEDRQRDSVMVKEIFLPLFSSFESFQKSSSEAWKLVKKLRSDSSRSLTEEYQPQYISFGKGDLPDIPVNFGTFLIDPKEGDVSYPLIGEEAFYVFWVEEREEGIPPFSEIKEKVRDSLVNYEAAMKAKHYALSKFTGDELPRNPEKGKWVRTPYFNLGNFHKFNIPGKIAYLALNFRKDKILPPVRAGEYVYVIKQIDFKMPKVEELKKIVPEVAVELQRTRDESYFQKWFYHKRKEYNIEDMRERLYE